ncbi:acyl-CoA reductase [Flaviaesturariibacter amylovorans]|uniref:Acyl-CoA reductase n=1 Tax=Flaviaesturariibacter amylovorans TaxID=1084520 RepID=A0ABP8GHY6_9BACT
MRLKLQERIELLLRLGEYMGGNAAEWEAVKSKAYVVNNWFTREFTDLAVENIRTAFLQPAALLGLAGRYNLPEEQPHPKKVGLVLAGNIPLVGFHDVLCTFLSGHDAWIKPSSKDEALLLHLVGKITEWRPEAAPSLEVRERLNGAEAFIATGSNNTSRYFEHYFARFPHIIRKNRTSVAVLDGTESAGELEKLADDICQYFGLGCRNVTALRVPKDYDFVPLLRALDKYSELKHHNKFRNNYDYNLAVHILNNKFYMSNDVVLLVEHESPFAPISQVHYQFYEDRATAVAELEGRSDIQCLVGRGLLPFGEAQMPAADTYADGVDTLQFLSSL